MFLKHIELLNYRNYEGCSLDFDSNKTVLIGDNAQGKTNLLESIYYISNLSSFRSNSDKELILWQKDFARIKCVLNKSDTDIELDVWINPPKKKVIKVNGIKKSKYSDFIGNLAVVSFGVDDLLLLRGAPENRRKWLDNSISQIYPAYADRMAKFNRIRNQRNNLLKSFAGNINISETQKQTVSIWDDQLVVTGSNIIYLRLKYLKEIYETALSRHLIISSNSEKLSFSYYSTILGEVDTTEELINPDKIAENFGEKIKENLNQEIIRAQTLFGPHRDDINFYINDIKAVSFASQGQQRTIVLSLKLAELDLIRQKTGETPLLLLDDVLAELDSFRQNYLLESISNNIQTIITSTDVNNFKENFLEDVKIIKIENGRTFLS
ncbi:MAG: DNA replication/repair protein RecF [Candidatus Gastranaerophilaceae bacterium]|jgi:DNA replication and repair protein RecF